MIKALLRRRGERNEDGALIFLVIMSVAMIFFAGLVVDGGARIRDYERANDVAAAAGRQGAEAVNSASAINGSGGVVDTAQAAAAARAYLDAQGVSGTVTVVNPQTLRIDTTIAFHPRMLPFMTSGPVHGHATIDLHTGI